MIPFIFRPALKTDLDDIKNLGNKIFGEGYLDNLTLPRTMNPFDGAICFVSTKEDSLVGMIYVQSSDDKIYKKISSTGFVISENIRAEETNKNQSAFLRLLMVDKQYRRMGIATSLYAKASQILANVNITNMYAICWKEGPDSAIDLLHNLKLTKG